MNLLKSLFNAIRGKEKFTGKHLVIVGAGFIFFCLFSAWSVSYTSQSEFCKSCHEMDQMYVSWTKSAHKNVACVDCHIEPGLEGTVKSKANAMRQVYTHFTSSDIKPKAEATDVNCLSCHQGKVITNTDRALSAKDPHTSKHFTNGMSCLSCHSGLVHDIKVNTTVPTRDNCVTCHLDQMNK